MLKPEDSHDRIKQLSADVPFGIFGNIIFGYPQDGHPADYERGAWLILEYYRNDPICAVAYLARFLSSVYEELDPNEYYMRSRRQHSPIYGDHRPSVAALAFARFQELMFHDPKFVAEILAHPDCSEVVRRESCLSNRKENVAALNRYSAWYPSGFDNPKPLPRELVQSYQREQQRIAEKCRLELDLKRRKEQLAHLERMLSNAIKHAKRQVISRSRGALLQHAHELPLAERIRLYLSNQIMPLVAWPVAPSEITSESLQQFHSSELTKLLDHTLKIRNSEWQAVCNRIKQELDARSSDNVK